MQLDDIEIDWDDPDLGSIINTESDVVIVFD
jgi:hypothetical protein